MDHKFESLEMTIRRQMAGQLTPTTDDHQSMESSIVDVLTEAKKAKKAKGKSKVLPVKEEDKTEPEKESETRPDDEDEDKPKDKKTAKDKDDDKDDTAKEEPVDSDGKGVKSDEADTDRNKDTEDAPKGKKEKIEMYPKLQEETSFISFSKWVDAVYAKGGSIDLKDTVHFTAMKNGKNIGSFQGVSDPSSDAGKGVLEEAVSRKLKVGDVVIPAIGPHKGRKHKVIHVFPDGKVNIQPIGLQPRQIRYPQGAAGAQLKDLTLVEAAPVHPFRYWLGTNEKVKQPSPINKYKSVDGDLIRSAATTKDELNKMGSQYMFLFGPYTTEKEAVQASYDLYIVLTDDTVDMDESLSMQDTSVDGPGEEPASALPTTEESGKWINEMVAVKYVRGYAFIVRGLTERELVIKPRWPVNYWPEVRDIFIKNGGDNIDLFSWMFNEAASYPGRWIVKAKSLLVKETVEHDQAVVIMEAVSEVDFKKKWTKFLRHAGQLPSGYKMRVEKSRFGQDSDTLHITKDSQYGEGFEVWIYGSNDGIQADGQVNWRDLGRRGFSVWKTYDWDEALPTFKQLIDMANEVGHKRAALEKTGTKLKIGNSTWTLQPDRLAQVKKDLAAGKFVSLTPSGMGQGYTLSRFSSGSRYGGGMVTDKDTLRVLGLTGLYYTTFDHD